MISVFMVDDHAVVREGLRTILEDASDMRIVGECGNGLEAMARIRETNPDVVILDIALPGKSGVDILSQIAKEKLRSKVVILSMYPEDQYAVRLLKDGASGYLTKESAPERLITAIRTVAVGRKFISPSVSELMLAGMVSDTDGGSHQTLSKREYQVFLLLASGKSTGEISKMLCLSSKTVGTYRSRLLTKLNLRNTVELTHYAIRNGLLV